MPRQPQNQLRKPQYAFDQISALPISALAKAVVVTNGNPQALPAAALYEGDLAYFIPADGVYTMPAGAMSPAIITALKTFLGVSGTTAPTLYWYGKLPDSATVYTHGSIVDLFMTVGDTYHAFDEVTIGADAQTITLVSNYAPALALPTASGTGATIPTANHIASLSWITPIGDVPSAATAPIAVTLGQNVVVVIPAIPAFASGAKVYLDGMFVGIAYVAGNFTISAPSTTGIAQATTNALAIGHILPQESTSQNFITGIPGVASGAGSYIRVAIRAKYPNNGAL